MLGCELQLNISVSISCREGTENSVIARLIMLPFFRIMSLNWESSMREKLNTLTPGDFVGGDETQVPRRSNLPGGAVRDISQTAENSVIFFWEYNLALAREK